MKKSYRHWTSILVLAALTLFSSPFLAPVPARAAQTFNVKKFGATGNGSTDDTSALQAAFAAANAIPGSTVLFPPGNYLYSSTLVADGIAVVGQHATLTEIAKNIDLELTGTHVSVQGMTFATQNDLATGVFVFQATKFSVSNNAFNTGFGVSIKSNLSSNGFIQSNKVTMGGNDFNALQLNQVQTVSIENNVVTSSSSNTSFLLLTNSSNVMVISNRASGGGTAVDTGSNSTVLYQHNVFSGYSEVGLDLGSDQNVTVSGNQFVGQASEGIAVILGSNVQNALVSDNSIQNGEFGIDVEGCNNAQISRNTVINTRLVGLRQLNNTTLVASGNTITHTVVGIDAEDNTNVSVTGNQIAQCQQQGIFGVGNTGTETIFNNAIRACGLAASDPPAVIFVDSPSASSISITHNSYTGNTANLQFFIRCEQPQPLAQVSGNSTNTGLPSVVGP